MFIAIKNWRWGRSFLMWPWCNWNRTEFFLEQKDVLLNVQPTMHLLLSVYNIGPPIARYVSLFSLLLVCWYANIQLRSFFLHSICDGAHVRKNKAFPACTTSHSRAGEAGNEAKVNGDMCIMQVPWWTESMGFVLVLAIISNSRKWVIIHWVMSFSTA